MDSLRKCQLLQLKIANEIRRVCDKNEIQFFLIAGTLLGAVRHKGFIPWDDDMDLGMTRDNYNRFISVAKDQLGKDFFLQTWDSEIEYGSPFAKVRLNETEFVEKNSESAHIHKGIYVDVFPFDNVPDNKFLKNTQQIKATFYKHLLLNKCNYNYVDHNNKIKVVVAKGLRLLSKAFSYDFIHRRFLQIMTKYNSQNTERVIAFGGSNTYSKEILKRDWIENLSPIEFEETQFYGPTNYDEYLTHFYGEYLIPPPENVRYKGHGIIRVSFGKYDRN